MICLSFFRLEFFWPWVFFEMSKKKAWIMGVTLLYTISFDLTIYTYLMWGKSSTLPSLPHCGIHLHPRRVPEVRYQLRPWRKALCPPGSDWSLQAGPGQGNPHRTAPPQSLAGTGARSQGRGCWKKQLRIDWKGQACGWCCDPLTHCQIIVKGENTIDY